MVAVACGGQHSAVHTAGQSVFCFGFNRYGQVGQGQACNKISTPRPVNMSGIGEDVGWVLDQTIATYTHTNVWGRLRGKVMRWAGKDLFTLGCVSVAEGTSEMEDEVGGPIAFPLLFPTFFRAPRLLPDPSTRVRAPPHLGPDR